MQQCWLIQQRYNLLMTKPLDQLCQQIMWQPATCASSCEHDDGVAACGRHYIKRNKEQTRAFLALSTNLLLGRLSLGVQWIFL
jgi:hypothetical protein